jgi:hypothetical protein
MRGLRIVLAVLVVGMVFSQLLSTSIIPNRKTGTIVTNALAAGTPTYTTQQITADLNADSDIQNDESTYITNNGNVKTPPFFDVGVGQNQFKFTLAGEYGEGSDQVSNNKWLVFQGATTNGKTTTNVPGLFYVVGTSGDSGAAISLQDCSSGGNDVTVKGSYFYDSTGATAIANVDTIVANVSNPTYNISGLKNTPTNTYCDINDIYNYLMNVPGGQISSISSKYLPMGSCSYLTSVLTQAGDTNSSDNVKIFTTGPSGTDGKTVTDIKKGFDTDNYDLGTADLASIATDFEDDDPFFLNADCINQDSTGWGKAWGLTIVNNAGGGTGDCAFNTILKNLSGDISTVIMNIIGCFVSTIVNSMSGFVTSLLDGVTGLSYLPEKNYSYIAAAVIPRNDIFFKV